MIAPIPNPMDTRIKETDIMLIPEIRDEGTKGTLLDSVISTAKVE